MKNKVNKVNKVNKRPFLTRNGVNFLGNLSGSFSVIERPWMQDSCESLMLSLVPDAEICLEEKSPN